MKILRKKIEQLSLDFGGLELGHMETTTAKDALCFMVNCVNSSWKIPLGFFFVAGLNAKGKAKINNRLRCVCGVHFLGANAPLQETLSVCRSVCRVPN